MAIKDLAVAYNGSGNADAAVDLALQRAVADFKQIAAEAGVRVAHIDELPQEPYDPAAHGEGL